MTRPPIPSGQYLDVVATGALSTVQDLGRPGYAHLGVPLSGAADRGALRLANRLVGNPEDAAGIEVTFGGLTVVARGKLLMVVTGARGPVFVDATPVGVCAAVAVRDGQTVSVRTPTARLRSYLAVRGGIEVDPVLGSRSTDTLSDLGPPVIREGDQLPIGTPRGAWPSTTEAPGELTPPAGEVISLQADPGPRSDALVDPDVLFNGEWVVNPASNRVGVRLDRPAAGAHPVPRIRSGHAELPSEGVALGSIQIPPSGQPVIFLADHPVTGGYPVAAVLTADATDRAAQLRPGSRVRFRR